MKYILQIVIIVFLFVLISFSVKAQVVITGVPFFEITNEARSVGLASSNIALRGSRGGLHLNPAVLANHNTIEITSQFNIEDGYGFFGTPWLPNSNREPDIFTPQLIVGFDKYSVGYQFTYFDLGKRTYIGEASPESIGKSNSYEFSHTFSLAHSLNQYMSIGVGLSFFKSSLVTEYNIEGETRRSVRGTTLDLGVYSEYPFQYQNLVLTPSLGWSITDIGKPISYTKDGLEDPLHTVMRGGLGLRLDVDEEIMGFRVLSVGIYGSLSKVMARRDEEGIPYGPLKAIFKSWDSFEKFKGQETISLDLIDQLRKHSGLEFTVLEVLNLRFGHFYEHPDNGNREYDTFGLGIQYKYFSFDYAKIHAGENPSDGSGFFQFSLNVSIEELYGFVKSF